jgi:hypothetical protein
MAGVLVETAARLLGAAGVTVTAVDLQVTNQDAVELRSTDVAARVELGTAGGTRHVMLSAGYGLALAAASGAPVRVADAVMVRLAVPVQDDDSADAVHPGGGRQATGPSRAAVAVRAAQPGVHRRPGQVGAVRQLPR